MMPPSGPKFCAWPAKAVRLRRPSTLSTSAPGLLYQWQWATQTPLPTDPAEAAEVRARRTANKRLTQEPDILKKAIAICQMHEAYFRIPRPHEHAAIH